MKFKGDQIVISLVIFGVAMFAVGTVVSTDVGSINWSADFIAAGGSAMAGIATLATAGIAYSVAEQWRKQLHYQEELSARKAFRLAYEEWLISSLNLCNQLESKLYFKVRDSSYTDDLGFDSAAKISLEKRFESYNRAYSAMFAAYSILNSTVSELELSPRDKMMEMNHYLMELESHVFNLMDLTSESDKHDYRGAVVACAYVLPDEDNIKDWGDSCIEEISKELKSAGILKSLKI